MSQAGAMGLAAFEQSEEYRDMSPKVKLEGEAYRAWEELNIFLREKMHRKAHILQVCQSVSTNRGKYVFPRSMQEFVGSRSGSLFIVNAERINKDEFAAMLTEYNRLREEFRYWADFSAKIAGVEDENLFSKTLAPLTYIDHQGEMQPIENGETADFDPAKLVQIESVRPVFRMLWSKNAPLPIEAVCEAYENAISNYYQKARDNERRAARSKSYEETARNMQQILDNAIAATRTLTQIGTKDDLLFMPKESHGFHFSVKMYVKNHEKRRVQKKTQRFTIPRACFVSATDEQYFEFSKMRAGGLFNYIPDDKAPSGSLDAERYFPIGVIMTPMKDNRRPAAIEGLRQYYIFAKDDDALMLRHRKIWNETSFFVEEWLDYVHEYYDEVVSYEDDEKERRAAERKKVRQMTREAF